MEVTDSGNLKHRQPRFEDYLQRVSAQQKEYAEVCVPPKMTETDNTNTSILSNERFKRIGYLSFSECYSASNV